MTSQIKENYKDVFDALEKGYFKIDKKKHFKNLDYAEKCKTHGENNVIKEFYIPVKATASKTIYANAIIEACNFMEAMRIFRNTPEHLLDIYEESVYEDDEWLDFYEYNEIGDHFLSIDGKEINFDPEEEINKITGVREIDFKYIEGQNLIWSEN